MSYSTQTLWFMIFAIGAGTFLIRFSFIWLFGKGDISPTLRRILRFVPASVLSALIAPSIFLAGGSGFSFGNERMWAGAVAALVAWKTKNVILTISAGMITLWLLSFFHNFL